MRKAYEHRTPQDFDRAIIIEISETSVRITCDAPGIAAVSHTLTRAEWNTLVLAVAAEGGVAS